VLRFVVGGAALVLLVWVARRWIKGEGLTAVRQTIVTVGLVALGAVLGAASATTVTTVRGPTVNESIGVIAEVRSGPDDLVPLVCVRERGDPVVPGQSSWCGALAAEVSRSVLAGEREVVLGWISPRDVSDRVIVSVVPVAS
jgi:hypothetical protein